MVNEKSWVTDRI